MEKVGTVTEMEKEAILLLFERKNALAELLITLDSPRLTEEERGKLSIKIAPDQKKTISEFDTWWHNMAIKYGWKSKTNGNWEINFETNEIFLNSI